MKYIKKLTAIILTVFLIIFMPAATQKPVKPLLPEGTKLKRSGYVQGVVINTISSRDFPYKTDLENNELSLEIQKMVKYLHDIGINTIFYEAVNEFQAMYQTNLYPMSPYLRTQKNMKSTIDPLKILKQQAEIYDIDVYALINPYKIGDTSKIQIYKNKYDILNDNAFTYANDAYFELNDNFIKHVSNVCKDIVKHYDLNGVIINDFNFDAYEKYGESFTNERLTRLFSEIKSKLDSLDNQAVLGAIFDCSDSYLIKSEHLALSFLDNLSIDVLLPKISESIENGYENKLSEWYNKTSKYGIPNITVNNSYKIFSPDSEDNYSESRFEINFQSIINEKMSIHGTIINSYASLVNDFTELDNAVSTLFLGDVKAEHYDYNITDELTVNFEKSRILNTNKKFVYVTGTCNPQKKLYLNNKEIENVMPNGIFGINLPVEEESNMFVFRQENSYLVIRIYKNKDTDEIIGKNISNIVEESIYPLKSEFIPANRSVELKCIAPAGSIITATIGKNSIYMEQVDDVPDGIATEYIADIKFNEKLPSSVVTDMGKVSYAMTYKGKISFSRSKGNLFAVGENCKKAIQVDDYIAYVHSEPNFDSPSLYAMKIGAKDYIVDEFPDFYELKSGGYISKNSVKLVSGNSKIESSYTSYYVESDSNGESISLIGNNAANVKTTMTDNSVIFTFYNTKVLPDIVPSNTMQFKNIIKLKIAPETYQLQFVFKDGIRPWGYNYKYFGENYENMRIDFKFKPTISETVSKPLENIMVLLDPDCVDTEFDESNVMENYGLHEAQINLNIAIKTKELLESLGATVQVTRYDNQYLSDFERMSNASQTNADFFISISHNHIKGGEDRMKHHGFQVEYSNKSWSSFADILTQSMENNTGRHKLSPIEKDNIVTQITSCPSVMLKNGYLSNPNEYEQILDPLGIYRTACGITEAILNMLS